MAAPDKYFAEAIGYPTDVALTGILIDIDATDITRATFPQVLDYLLPLCESELSAAKQSASSFAFIRDMKAAVDALRLISSDIHRGIQGPKGQKSAMFTRYVYRRR